jgi:hypothetical protein
MASPSDSRSGPKNCSHHRRDVRHGARNSQALRRGGCVRLHHGRRKDKLDGAVKLIGKNVIGVQGDAANLADLLHRWVSNLLVEAFLSNGMDQQEADDQHRRAGYAMN